MNLHLAPLKNISCWAFRATAIGATDSYTEMTNLKSLLMKRKDAWRKIDTFPIPSQRQWLQVLTHDLRDMALLPNRLKQFYSDYPDRAHIFGININAGCPDKDVIAAGDGAALIKRTKRLIDLILAFLGGKDSHDFHVSCKLRLGLHAKELKYKKYYDFLQSLQTIEDPRLSPSIIHFKHARQESQETPKWNYLDVALNAGIPFVINGNISTLKQVKNIRENLTPHHQKQWDKLIDGVMIGRAAIKNLDCFQNFHGFQISRGETSWQERFKQNIKMYPLNKRFISSFHEMYPFAFQN